MLARVGLRPIREYEGEIFTDYYFSEVDTANKSDNLHNNAINKNLNWGGFPGCYKKLRLEASIPRKLEDGWDPMIKIKLNNFSYFALCDVGASTSVMPKRMYGMLDLKPFDPCSFGVRLVDSSVKKPLGKIDDVLIIVNDNYVPLISLLWTLSVSPLVRLFWDVLFFAQLVLLLT